MFNTKKRSHKLKWLLLFAVVITIYVAVSQSSTAQYYLKNPAALKSLILGFGLWAPVIIVLLQVTQTIVSIFPSQITTIVSGFIFGPVLGLGYSLLGATIGSGIVFLISKKYGKRLALHFFHKEDLVHFNMFFKQKQTWSVIIARITPVFPNDLVSFAAGLTPLRFWQFNAVSTIGFILQMLILAFFGAGLVTGKPNFWLYFFRFLVTTMIVVLVFRKRFKKLFIKDVHKLEKEGKMVEKAIEKEFKKI